MKYKIHVKTINNTILTFSVNEYEVKDGFVHFIDSFKNNKPKCFHGSNCEIEGLQ
jgi:hypothetical protein